MTGFIVTGRSETDGLARNGVRDEVEALRLRAEEAEDALRAIQGGAVDGLRITGQTYTMDGAELPYRMMVEQMREGACTLSALGVVLYANRRFAEMLAMPLQRLIGYSLPRLVPAEYIDRFQHLLTTGLHEAAEEEIELRGTHGRRVPVMLAANPFELDGQRSICLIITDLTRQRTHERLRESEQRYRRQAAELDMVYRTAPVGLALLDCDHRIVKINEALAQLRNRPISDHLGYRLYDLLPGLTAPMRPLVQRVIDENTAILGHELTVKVEPNAPSRTFVVSLVPITDGPGPVEAVSCLMHDITQRRRAAEHQQMLLAELSHRVKNTLATVNSIALQTATQAESVTNFVRGFQGRLQALARAHSLLTRSNWQGANLRRLIEQELEPHISADRRNVTLEGPELELRPRVALSLHMCLHELATNAAKYGALSVESGLVQISWSITNGRGDSELVLRWRETGGPKVSPPARRGFGTDVIETSIEYELGGGTKLDYLPTGVVCTFRLPWNSEASAYAAGG